MGTEIANATPVNFTAGAITEIQRLMAEPDFDRVKVESIKRAIQDGQYPLNPRRIAESFQALEQMISE